MVAIIAIGVLTATWQGPALGPVGALVTDGFQRAKPRAFDPTLPVRIVEIDAESLARFGQWPWPRPYLAELVSRLADMGAAAIALDILFAEPDRTSPELVYDAARRFELGAGHVERAAGTTLHDTQFAQSLVAAPTILVALPGDDAPAAEPLTRKFGFLVAGSDPRPRMAHVRGVNRALPELVEAATGYGLGGISVSEGSVVRRAPLFSVVGGDIAPSVSMEALRVAQGAGGYGMRSSDASGEGGGAEPVVVDARNGTFTVPLSADGGYWIRYAGHQPDRFLPAWQVLDGVRADPALADRIAGHIVLVAATAPGLATPVETPLGTGVHPAEIHAEVLEQVMSGITLQRPDWAPGAEALAVVLVGLVTAVTTIGRSALTGFVLGGVLPMIVMTGSWLAFDRAGLLLSPVTPVLSGAALYTVLTAVNYFRYRRESGAVRAQFERFVAPQVIRELVADPDSGHFMQGTGRELTLLFADARGFTSLSEQMPPGELIGYINACFGETTEAVLAEGGTVDKYMGDCIMAFWNAPLDVPDHPARALRAAFEIRAAQERLNARFAERGLPLVDFGVGLNTGFASVGLMGSPRRLEYSCVGDTVNIASRLQDLTKLYGTWNIVAESVIAAAPGWHVVPLGPAALRNRRVPVPIVTVLGPESMPLPPHLATYRDLVAEARAALDAGRDAQAALAALAAFSAPGLKGAQLAATLASNRRAEAA